MYISIRGIKVKLLCNIQINVTKIDMYNFFVKTIKHTMTYSGIYGKKRNSKRLKIIV